jgi:isoquinoline 1-oxidoreductase beta subunit
MKNKLSGPGLTLGFRLSAPDMMGESGGVQSSAHHDRISPSDFLHIDNNGDITIILSKSEMGQGVYTAMAMFIAEELECDWARIRIEPAPVNSVYNNPMTGMQMTGGSLIVRTEWDRLRMIGAAAREMLLQAAADT